VFSDGKKNACFPSDFLITNEHRAIEVDRDRQDRACLMKFPGISKTSLFVTIENRMAAVMMIMKKTMTKNQKMEKTRLYKKI
jgi:hypothetical protein